MAIIVATDDVARYRTALMLAAATAAAGGSARIFLNERAVGLFTAVAPPDEAALASAGLPTLAELQDEALSLGVRCIACASGLALTAIDPALLDARIETGGIVGIATSLGEDRLVIV